MSVAVTVRPEALLLRHSANPILSAKDWPYSVNSVFNAGATLMPDGSTLLLCRVEDRRGLSHFCSARSLNGVDHWQVDNQPTLMPNPREYPEEIWGIEDPRLTFVPELQQYAVTYTSYSRGGPGVSLALTNDFRTFERYGVIMPPDDKDSALLPRKINGYWALIHRPMTPLGAHMLLSDARAPPPLISGTIVSSRTATLRSSTRYSSFSRTDAGGLKVHCWRTISRNGPPGFEDERNTNSCVRGMSFSSNTTEMRLIS